MVSARALSIIRDAIASEKLPLHLFIVFPKIGVNEIDKLKDRAVYKGSRLSIDRLDNDVFRFFVKLKKRSTRGYIITYNSFWIFLTYGQESETKPVTSILLKKLYPLIYYQYIPVGEFLTLIEDLSKVFKLVVKEYLLRRKIIEKGERKRRLFREVIRSWTEQRFSRKTFEEIMKRESVIIDALRLAISSYEYFADLRVYRNGSITVYKGPPDIYPDIYRLIIEPYIKVALGNIERLRRVRRVFIKKKLDSEIHSLTLLFEDYKLTKDDYRLILDNLSKQFFVSVYHLGNPILHALLTDREEGSSFEIIAYGNKVEILPDFKASAESLQIILDVLTSIHPHNKYIVT